MTPAQITRQFPFEIDEIVLKGYFISLFYFSNILYLNSFIYAMIWSEYSSFISVEIENVTFLEMVNPRTPASLQ